MNKDIPQGVLTEHTATMKQINDILQCLPDDYLFKKFLRKVDRTPQSLLIAELFGSKQAYIDSPGDYAREERRGWRSSYEHNIAYAFVAAGHDDDLLEIFAWYSKNLRKSWEWVYSRKRTPQRKELSSVG